MRQERRSESMTASKVTPRHEEQKVVPVLYGQKIYIKNLTLLKEGSYLWGRGFIDSRIYLSTKSEQIQSQFTIEPKKGLYSFEDKTTTPVVFGAEILIKHVVSQQYIAIGDHDGMPILQFQKNQSSSCYFQFSPLRTFESNGNTITTDSIFLILNPEKKLYLTDQQEMPALKQPTSPTTNFNKRVSISRDESSITFERPASGSVAQISLQNQEIRLKEQFRDSLNFKKKFQVKKMPANLEDELMKTKKQQISFMDYESPTVTAPVLLKTSSFELVPQIERKKERPEKISQKQSQKHSIQGNARQESQKQYEQNAQNMLNLLPIYKKQRNLSACSVQNYSYSQWKIQVVKTDLRTHYLNNNDYIYFTHSQSNQTMVVDIEKQPLDVAYIKNTNESESQFMVSSIFVVQIEKRKNFKCVYLKHFLTGRYFPFTNGKKQQEKKICELVPLLAPKKNQCPPFKIIFAGKQFNKKGLQNQKEVLHGFWLNKIPKAEIAQIMSIQYVDKETQIEYLINYLKENTKRRQNILREFQYIPHLINELTVVQSKMGQNLKEQKQKQLRISKTFQLLFYICRNNEKNKKQCLKYIDKILAYSKKQEIIDLLTELLIDNTNNYFIEKAITPSIIENQINEFVYHEGYSTIFMRIFRVFCGSDEQPSVRNQCLLFNLFFWGQKAEDGNGMTQSVLHSQKNVCLHDRFKFRVFEQEDNIYFSNSIAQQKFENISENVVNYIRQYLYLLSDCMNGSNYTLIKNFTSAVSFNLLLKLLEKVDLKGPALSLLYNAYLKPQKKYKPNIFHRAYEKMCDKGRLIHYCKEDEARLRHFLQVQLRQNKKFNSTTFRILLNVFKLTIQNGYWQQFDNLIELVGCLDGLIQSPQPENTYHLTFEEKAQDRNLLRSKITAISIKLVLIDVQVSLWASNFQQYSDRDIEQKIVPQIKNNKNWIIDEKILKLCSTNSPQLLRKAILLLYKIYNLYKLTQRTFQQAQIEFNSKVPLTKVFETLQLKDQMSIQNYFCMIAACIKDPISLQQVSPKSLKQNDYLNLQSMFKYKQVNEQVQNMVYKLGMHQALIKDIKRYTALQKHKKFKQQNQEIIYWKLLTLYALIRYNSKLRDIIAEHRSIFIPFIQSEHPNYYVAVDIIQEIYRNNRKLIISDNEQLKEICKSIDKVFRTNRQDLRCCKIVNLLSVFIETGNRRIVQNYQIILQIVFNRNFVKSVTKIMTTSIDRKQSASDYIRESYPKNILRIVLYDLLVVMGQKKMLRQLERPKNDATYALLLIIGNNNWSLKGKAFLSIKYEGIKQEKVKQCLRIILFDLNYMCESIKVSHDQFKQTSKQVKIYISNMNKILQTIDQLFKTCVKNLEKGDSDEEIFVIKIIERLFIMKALCPQTIHKKIEALLHYIDIIEKRLVGTQKCILRDNLQKIEIGDFQKNEIKQRLPLIYSQKITKKRKIQKINLLEQKSTLVEQVVLKKGKIQIKINDINKSNFELTQGKIRQLKTLIISLSNLNKNDSRFLSDNIKQFLVNFVRTSFLECGENDQLIKMQDILVNYQVPTLVCSILEEPFKHRYKLFCSVFELGIKLLLGGHTKCQEKFLQKFKEDGKNWIFQNIYEIILDSLATIEFYYHYKQDPTIKSYQMILEVEEYYICKQERRLSCQLLANAFRFLQLLCQNDNHSMKQYIYNQLDKEDHVKYMSKNFIEVAQRLLDGIMTVIWFNIEQMSKMPNSKFQQQVRGNIFNLPIYILDFLIQVCQIPAEQNQLYLCRTDFLDFIKKLIAYRETILKNQKNKEGKDWNIFFTFERKIIILLKSLLQQNSQEIANLVRKKIGKNEFIFFIEQSFTHGGLKDTDKLKQMLTQMQLNNYVENIVDVLIIKKILKNQETLQFKSDDPLDPEKKSTEKVSIVNELNNRIQSIHVDFKNHSLTVYFPFHPLFGLLGRKTKDFMLDRSASLTTRRQKLTQLLISRELVYQDINRQKNAEKWMMNPQKMSYIFNFALFLCYLIVFLLVLFYSVGKSGAVLDIYEVQIISGLSYMQLLVIVIYTLLLGFNLYPIAKQKMKAYDTLRKRSLNNSEQGMKLTENNFLSYLRRVKSVYVDQGDSAHALILLIISLYACFFEVRVYSFSLIFVFAKIELLESILKSIRLTWQQLVFVSLLALAFSFIFGFITLNNYIGPLYQNQQIDIDIDRINEHCNSIITCVSSLYTQKIIGQSVSREDEEYNYGRFISDLVYWGFFEILLSNIIAAIIIDKFAQQRNVKEKILHDRYSKCYICFADRTTLQRRGEDFMSHVNHVHNLWNYFFYIYTLQNLKDITDFTGIQYWINRQLKNNLIDWIPIDDSFKQDEVNLSALVQRLKPMLTQKQAQQK